MLENLDENEIELIEKHALILPLIGRNLDDSSDDIIADPGTLVARENVPFRLDEFLERLEGNVL